MLLRPFFIFTSARARVTLNVVCQFLLFRASVLDPCWRVFTSLSPPVTVAGAVPFQDRTGVFSEFRAARTGVLICTVSGERGERLGKDRVRCDLTLESFQPAGLECVAILLLTYRLYDAGSCVGDSFRPVLIAHMPFYLAGAAYMKLS